MKPKSKEKTILLEWMFIKPEWNIKQVNIEDLEDLLDKKVLKIIIKK